jgi:hypothetical protein
LFGIDPRPPVIFQVISGLFNVWWADALAITSPDEVDEKPVEQV